MGLTFNTAANRSVNTGTDFRTGVQGNMWYKEFEFNTVADASPNYTTGGIDIGADPINNSKFGLARVDHCDIETKGGFVFNYDIATDKILMWQSDDSADAQLVQETDGAAPAAVTNIKGMAWGQI